MQPTLRPTTTAHAVRRGQRGMALLETVIGLALGLIALLVIVQSFTNSEQFMRAAGGQADAQQRGTIATWRLTRELRMAGSGLGNGASIWGCTLNAWLSGARILPRATPWPEPFDNLPTTLLLTPVAVADGTGLNGSDQVLFASARTAAGAVPSTVSIVSAGMVQSTSTAGFQARDLLLVTDATAIGPCQLGQVDTSYAPVAGVPAPTQLPTGAAGTTYNAPTGFANLPQPGDYTMVNLGGGASMQMIGLNDEGQLMLLDALGTMTGADPVVLAENVVQFQVVYGLDNGAGGGVANDNVVDEWVSPRGAWAFANLHSAAGNALRVKALRIAVVIRSDSRQGRTGAASVTMFPDLPPADQVVFALSANEQSYQLQVYDLVIPLRNAMAALCAEHRRASAVAAPGTCS